MRGLLCEETGEKQEARNEKGGFFFASFAGYFVFVRDYLMISFAVDLPKASTAAIASDGFFICVLCGIFCIRTRLFHDLRRS